MSPAASNAGRQVVHTSSYRQWVVQMAEKPKYYGKNRSIVRRIGSFLPLKPLPKIYVSVTALHSMSNSMIVDDANSNIADTNGFGLESGRLSGSKPDLLETISFGSEVRLLALEQELQEMREKIATIVQHIKTTDPPSDTTSENAYANDPPRPPPPPPPLPPPSTPHIARRASLQDHTTSEWHKPPLNSQKSMGDILKEMDKVKLKPIARSPGGGPLKLKRGNTPNNDLQEILRKRYSVVQAESPDSRNSSIISAHNDSFTH
ncbi:mitochondrial fission regulator 2-like isoform X2 [Neodiprion fabricii]|uniref:mitochondrial fission regulator 2-like isoform X2 n=1 Tax=Neodiprion fabricii TaxID=2872261 RepID=UPI001ED91381|nr:mitochondrial fission regulator 2-like isoform X2 [Neodiprion fabricii]